LSKKFRFIVKDSFGFKIVAAFIMVIIVVLSVYTVFAVVSEINKARKNLREQGTMLAELLAYSSSVGAFAENEKLLADAAQGIIAMKEVLLVSIYNVELKKLYSKGRIVPGNDAISVLTKRALPGDDARPVNVVETENTFEFIMPIVIKPVSDNDELLYFGRTAGNGTTKVIGYVRVTMGKDSYSKEILSLVLRNAVIMIVFILSSIAIVYVAVKKVTRPLEQLTEKVKALGGGLPVEQVPIETGDEIGNLASAFNVMVIARGRAEESLRRSEEKYRSLVENIGDVLYTLDTSGRFTYISPAVERMCKYAVRDFPGIAFIDFVEPADRAAVQSFFLQALNGHAEPHEFRARDKDGRTFFVRASSLPLRGDDGAVIGLSGVLADVSERKQAEEKLRIYHERVAALAVELSRTEERERRRIANDLHDHIGQILALSKIKLGCLKKERPESGFLGKIDEIRDLIDQSIQYTRTLTFELSPSILYELGLGAALEWLAETVSKQHGLPVAVEVEGSLDSLDDEKRILLFKVVRELLHNVVKHARAQQSRVRSWTGDGRIWITVEDDGIGFDQSKTDFLSAKTRGFGLFSIRESLKLGGGNLNILSEPNRGTKVTLSVPLTN